MAISTKDNNTLKKKDSSLGNMLKGTGLFIGIFIVVYIVILFATWVLRKIKYLPFFYDIFLLNYNFTIYWSILCKNMYRSKTYTNNANN